MSKQVFIFMTILPISVMGIISISIFGLSQKEKELSYLEAKKEVFTDIAQEYSLNIQGVYELQCISGFWHYSIPTGIYSKQVVKFEPESDCSKDRGIEARVNEKLNSKGTSK